MFLATCTHTQRAMITLNVTHTADNPRHNSYRITFDGRVLSDSRGYSYANAVAEMHSRAARYADECVAETINPPVRDYHA